MRASALGVWLAVTISGVTAEISYGQTAAVGAGELQRALEAQTRWLATSPEGAGWTKFLRIDSLREQLTAGSPDRSLLDQVLQRYSSARPGLETPEFVKVRSALERWLAQVPIDSAQMIAEVRSAREKYVAPTSTDEAAARAKLAETAAQLDRYLAARENGA